MNDFIVEVSSVSKVYKNSNSGKKNIAVADVSFTASQGEVVCIVGKTGCGKSTMSKMLLGLQAATTGSIKVCGLSPYSDFMSLRGKIVTVFQTDRLLPWRTIKDNIAIGLQVLGVKKDERRRRAIEWLDKVGLNGWEDAYPSQLSGGMRQRVAIARAFVINPDVIILDEAFGHLDEVTAQSVRNICMQLVRETKKTAIVITHNIHEALDIGDKVLVFSRPAQIAAHYNISEMKTAKEWTDVRKNDLRDEIFSKIDSSDDMHAAR